VNESVVEYQNKEKIMKIEVLGPGCARCMTLYENTKKALEESGKSAEIVKVEDLPTIMKYGVMSTPALVIDGQVKFSGKVASVADIIGIL
jgi:small redox-active disulfide protein 2